MISVSHAGIKRQGQVAMETETYMYFCLNVVSSGIFLQ